MIYFSLLSMTVWYIQAIFHLNPRWWCACFLWVLLLIPSKARSELDGPRSQDKPTYTAIVNITYKDSKTGESKSEKINGCYGMNSLIEPETGIVVHVRSGPPDSPTRNDACYPYFDNVIPSERWVALIERGECPFSEKIKNAAKKYNASAVVIYNNHSGEEEDKDVINMQHEAMDVVAIFIGHASGMRIASLLEEGTRVTMHISKGQKVTNMKEQSSISKTSVLFVSISFIVLMIISLAWLVFYYIQRFRYAHAKERLSRRLASAAKKAISKIPQRTVRTGDKELDSDYDQCAVCIEGYKNSDVIRILPCKHVYHKSCVDPWLMDQRSCPMCKMDILRAYGMQINIHCSQESMVPADPESGTVSGMMDEVEPSSSPDEMGAVGGVKIVHFTHPSIQYHPRSLCPEGGATSELPCSSASSPEDTTQAASTSACEDSGHLSDCECNELQSLMKTSSRKGSGSSKDSSSLAGESHS